MPDTDDNLIDELAAGTVEAIPFLGGILGVFTRRGSEKIRAEWARNTSKALRAAERISRLSREELADRISENPRLIPLVIRVLHTAGMTGQDAILSALGTALGDAVRDPANIDEAELLLIGMAYLREYHIVILKIMNKIQAYRDGEPYFTHWTSGKLADESRYGHDPVNICIAGLVQSGLIHQVDDAYGLAYEISDLGRTALEVLDKLDEEIE